MKYSTFILPENQEPQTLSENVEKAIKELSYMDFLLVRDRSFSSPFDIKERTLSPTEYVSKFVKEQLKK